MRQRGFGHIKKRNNIGLERIHQLFFRNIHNTVLMKLHAVIIHQDVEASKGFDRCLHNVTASVFLPQICSSLSKTREP
jgi:hypothetical protein